MNKIFMLIGVVALFSCEQKSDKAKENTVISNEDGSYSEWMAKSEMKRNPDPRLIDFRDTPRWGYTNGLVCSAIYQVWQKTGDSTYFNYVNFYADSMILESGTILTYSKNDYNIDRVNSGKVLIELYKQTGIEKYRKATDTLRNQMKTHPRTSEGGFWHKKRYPHQMWLDGLYMGSPFLAQYALEFDEPELFDDIVNQVYLIDKYAWNPEKELYFHGWDESREQRWSDPETGRSPHAWGRAMGWFAMSLVDMLDFFPKDHPKRQMIENVHQKVADVIIAQQDTSGLWWQVLDRPGEEGNYLEASASSMFTYFLLKSVNKKYLGEKYADAGKHGFEGLINNLIKENEDGTLSLTQVCGVAGLGGNPYRDGSYEYYINEIIRDNDPKGVGPFIMASLEFEELKSN